MVRQSLFLLGFCLALAPLAGARAENVLISQSTAQRHGLTKAWFTQIELDKSSDYVAYITQQGGMLYVQTGHAVVHALDAETGRRIWNVQIGRRNQMSYAPGVNENLLAVINGSTLYVVERKTGKLKWERQMVGAPGAGPALSKKRLYVAMVDGEINGFNLEDTKELPFVYKSAGRILIQPVMTEASLSWTTDKGYFYVADADAAKVRFRIETQGEINSPPGHWTPYLYACSLDGYVYAVNEVTGRTVWKFSSGQPINKGPIAIADHVYIMPDLGGMFCLDGKTGAELWFAPGVTDFCSANDTKIYALDRLNRLTTLDVKTGSRLDTMPLPEIKTKLINQQTDRIYLASDNGVIQCLHEIGLEKPVTHTPPPLEKKGAAKETKQKPLDDNGDADDEAPKGKKPAMKADEDEEEDGMKADDPFADKDE